MEEMRFNVVWWRPGDLDQVTRGSVELVITLRASGGPVEFRRWLESEPRVQSAVWLDRAWRIRRLDEAGRRRRAAPVLGCIEWLL